MSVGLARNWWVVGLRAIAAALLLVGLVASPPAKIASLVLVFAAYLAADGVLAILAGTLAARRGERWWLLVLEGSVNLGVAGVILIWPAIVAVSFLDLANAWAIVTGALMLAAAHRLPLAHGRALLVSPAWCRPAGEYWPQAPDCRRTTSATQSVAQHLCAGLRCGTSDPRRASEAAARAGPHWTVLRARAASTP
jgi:hypothetical protein